MNKIPMIGAVVLTLGGITLFILGIAERSGAYDDANFQKGKLEEALGAWEKAKGTPGEAEAKLEAESWNFFYTSSMETGASRVGRSNVWIILGFLLLLSNIGMFFLAKKMKAKAGGKEASS